VHVKIMCVHCKGECSHIYVFQLSVYCCQLLDTIGNMLLQQQRVAPSADNAASTADNVQVNFSVYDNSKKAVEGSLAKCLVFWPE
jgi:hypothetical protein